jgi:hypothetical protein
VGHSTALRPLDVESRKLIGYILKHIVTALVASLLCEAGEFRHRVRTWAPAAVDEAVLTAVNALDRQSRFVLLEYCVLLLYTFVDLL